jgi:hypothetical protein
MDKSAAPERKTLVYYLLHGGAHHRYFSDKVYDPENPIYRVENIRVIDGDRRMIIIDRVMLPDGHENCHDLMLHPNDLEATSEEVENAVEQKQIRENTCPRCGANIERMGAGYKCNSCGDSRGFS